MTKWAYRVEKGRLSLQELNDLGKAGWELIQIVLGESGTPYYHFKRPY